MGFGKQGIVNRLVCFVLILWIPAAIALDVNMAEVRAELENRRARLKDFNRRQVEALAEARERARNATAVTQERDRKLAERERLRLAFVRSKPPRDDAKLERLDRMYELYLQEKARRRDVLRQAYVRARDRVQEIYRQGPQIDEELEYDLKGRDENRADHKKSGQPAVTQ